jgi:peptidoglycan hydrolase-like protein with peptidoglycan-binding domain
LAHFFIGSGIMATFQLGSSGEPVQQIQQALQSKKLYQGPLDGVFGGGTQAAVRRFQRGAGLEADGVVGPASWDALVGNAAPAAAPAEHQGLDYRCLALTGTFETGKGVPKCFSGLSGDFDGQGISYGALQWNFGQGSLQPLLRDMVETHEAIARDLFGPHFDALAAALALGDGAQARADLLAFARSIQHPVKYQVFEPWRGYAKALGRTPEFQAIQVRHAHQAYERALGLCADYGLWSERAAALMFDIVTQNGSIGPVTRAQIVADAHALPGSLGAEEREVQVLRLVANHRAQASNIRWVDDVRRRKLCIANGGGVVHGIRYDLAAQFQIGLVRREAAA